MPIPTPAATSSARCAHEPRPGTVVCLHCRREARLAADAQRNRFLAKVGGGVLLAGVVIGGAVLGFRALTADTPAVAATPASTGTPPAQATRAPAPSAAPEQAASEQLAPDAFATTPGGARVTLAADAGAPVLPPPPPARPETSSSPAPAGMPDGPVVAEGRTELGSGVVAVRTGNTVVVHFDTPEARTRRHDKFERIVRETLPAIYGPLADAALDAVPPGTLGRDGDLLTELPTRGAHLRAPGGARLALWPTTRPGRDGPLVVAYRTTLLR